MTNSRMKPKERTAQLLDVAIDLAAQHGLSNVRRDQIAEAAGVSQGIVTLRLGEMPEMRRAVMRQAVKRGILSIIAEGLVNGDKHATKADPDLKQRALASLTDKLHGDIKRTLASMAGA